MGNNLTVFLLPIKRFDMKIGKKYNNTQQIKSLFEKPDDVHCSEHQTENSFNFLKKEEGFTLLDYSFWQKITWIKVLTESGIVGWTFINTNEILSERGQYD